MSRKPKLNEVLVELLDSEGKTIPLEGGLYLKYEPAQEQTFQPHRLMMFRKGTYAHEGPHVARNWPSDDEFQTVMNYFFKAMRKLGRTITGRIPKTQANSCRQNEKDEWFYARSVVWLELVQGGLPLGMKESGYRED